MPLITICDGCGQEIGSDSREGRYELEIPTGDEWWASERLTFHSRDCLAWWLDRTDPDGAFCPRCAPDALPAGADSPTPVSEDHYGLRFRGPLDPDVLYTVPFIDGERADRVVELLCGENGWAIMHDLDRRICPIHHDYLVRVVYGDVRVESLNREPSVPATDHDILSVT